jgi:hypothetical protein
MAKLKGMINGKPYETDVAFTDTLVRMNAASLDTPRNHQ